MNILAGLTRAGHSAFRNPKRPAPHSPINWQNRIHFDVVGPDENGNLVTKQQVRNVENIMVTYGLASIMKVLSTSTQAGSSLAQAMAIGTDNTAVNSTHAGLQASTQLISGVNTFSRSELGNMTGRYLGTFASDGNAASIREIGIFCSNVASASMLCRSILTGTQSINRGASDQINVSYDIVASTV